jgi:hypothetical protein
MRDDLIVVTVVDIEQSGLWPEKCPDEAGSWWARRPSRKDGVWAWQTYIVLRADGPTFEVYLVPRRHHDVGESHLRL